MSNVKFISAEETEKMFGRFAALRLDTSDIRRKFLSCLYGEDHKQALDIYLPNEGGGPFPAVLFLHGGGWSGGNKKDAQLLPFIGGVKRGWAVIGLGYRLVPNIRYPENLFDVKAALRWLKENADTYLIDADRVALAGASAGAHLAMMAAFTMGQAVFEGAPLGPTCTVRAVVGQYGPTDFLAQDAQFEQSGCPRVAPPDPDAMDAVTAMLGVRPSQIPNLMRFLNPIDNVHAAIPPVLLQHGRYDPVIPYQQSAELHRKITAVCGEGHAELDLSDVFTHAEPGYAEPESVERIFSFLDRRVRSR
jgi:acetyl esterase/lipase